MPHPSTEGQQLHALCAHVRSLGHTLTPFYFETFHPIDGAGRIACCQACGRPVSFGGSTAHSDALYHPCDADADRALEGLAALTGRVPRLLLERLTTAVAELSDEVRRFFVPGHFDDKMQCLDSEDYVWRLQWHPRKCPDDPIDQDNPQPPDGIVELGRRVPEDAMRPARYVGRRYNPNFSEDPKDWLVEPLSPQTQGLAYYVDENRWYFRRIEGVVGYYVKREDVQFETPALKRTSAITAVAATAPGSAALSSGPRSIRDSGLTQPEFPRDLTTDGALDSAANREWNSKAEGSR